MTPARPDETSFPPLYLDLSKPALAEVSAAVECIRASSDDAERFDSDLLLMTGELAKMLDDVVFALGGMVTRK